MQPIYKIVTILTLLSTMVVSVAAASGQDLNRQRESILYATLVAMGFESSTAIVTDNEVVVDYVIKPLQSDLDLVLQLQSIFIAAAKVAPDTVLTVIKGRYRADYPPMLVVAVPNDVTQELIAEAIEPASFWQMVAINDETLMNATETQERRGLKESAKARLYASLSWNNTSLALKPDEFIRGLGMATGLGEVAIHQLNRQQPALLKPLHDTLLAVKIADLLAGARDPEALAMLLPWQSSQTMIRLLETVYPPTMRPWFDAITRYKVSLLLWPSDVTPPAMDAEWVASYMAARGGSSRPGKTPQQAYQGLTHDKAFFSLRQKLYDDLRRSREQTRGEVEQKVEQYLWGKTDTYLLNRFEAAYQRELFRSKRQSLADYLWGKKQTELERLRQAVIVKN